MELDINIWYDGACDNKVKKTMGIGVYAEVLKNRERIEFIEVMKNYGQGTSNVAEWMGCCHAMEIMQAWSHKYPTAWIRIYSDSQLITRQFNGVYQINRPEFLQFFDLARNFYNQSSFRGSITWIRRELNTRADELSKVALLLPIEKFNIKNFDK